MTGQEAELILQCKDAIVKQQWAEAYHALYQIASPNFDKFSDEVWLHLEILAGRKESPHEIIQSNK